ncbi:leucine-rich repeat domain-containing protein [Viscerimonas tarda]
MKIKKLFFAVACCLATSTGFAQISGQCGADLFWSLNSGTLTISGTGAMADAPWYDYRTDITTIEIQDGATTIGYGAFRGCSALRSVAIPNGVVTIGEGAFFECSALPSVVIPSSVTRIDVAAFARCSNLTSLTIPNSVTTIGEQAFAACSLLASVTISNRITSIDAYLFHDCISLTSVTIPASVITIGSDAFVGCSNLADIYVHNTTPPQCVASHSISFFSYFARVSGTLHVPAGSKAAYQIASEWKKFTDIQDDIILGIETVSTNDPIISTQYYNLQGIAVKQPQQGSIYIVRELHRSGKVTVSKTAP